MRVRYWFVPVVVVATAVLCHSWMTVTCTQAGPCVTGYTQRQLWVTAFSEAFLLLVAATVTAWLVRAVWLLATAARQTRRLCREEWPAELRAAVARTGACRVDYVAGGALIAFCAGTLRPRVFVTRALVSHLRADELDAVLLHERNHSRRRDPLRYAMRLAAADACFYLPLLRW